MSLNMAWAALKSAVGAAPAVAAAATQVATEQVLGTRSVQVLQHFRLKQVQLLCKCIGAKVQWFQCSLFLALGVNLFNIFLCSLTIWIAFPPSWLPLYSPNSFKIIDYSTLQASAAVRTLATVKPHVPMIKVSEIVKNLKWMLSNWLKDKSIMRFVHIKSS